ncbi:hypothetical protein PVAP13_7KG269255 [Panicum virgatum]|uniref:Uncharacterized protein n=1 Tax=Panicum virgatum TaxID=38727 RepID=A0A8T0QJ50_PANVG|nr:hypothetical protein PVAP13_7KG269255 [Panicum virgatum]
MGEGEVVKKMGAWTTGKGPKGGRIGGWEEERSKQRGRPRVCGEDDALAGCRASDERERDYKRKGWWRMYCCVVRMCISIYPPGGPRRSVLTLPLASPSQHGTQRRREHKPLARPTLDRTTATGRFTAPTSRARNWNDRVERGLDRSGWLPVTAGGGAVL